MMQVGTTIIRRSILVVIGILIIPILIYATSFADFSGGQYSNVQYGSNEYGGNAYGKAGTLNTNPANTSAAISTTKPRPSESKPKSALATVIQTVVSPAITVTEALQKVIVKLNPAQQRVIPMFIWYVIAIMALILLIEAYLNRRQSRVLAKTIDNLRETAQDQKNFSRLVLHNLNTPLALIKNLYEMLSEDTKETQAVQSLKEPTLGLASTIEFATQVASEDQELATNSVSLPKSDISLISILKKWYFIVPVAIALIIGAFTNTALYRLGTSHSGQYIMFQAVSSVVIILIFGNALRIFSITQYQHKILETLVKSIEVLNIKRSRVLTSLNSSLGPVVERLKAGSKTIHDTKIASLLNGSLAKLNDLSYKVTASDQPLSKAAENCNVPDLVTELIAKYKDNLDKNKLRVSTNFKLDKPVFTHLPELRLMIDTLLENAIDYSKEDETINISAEIVKDRLKIQIQDSGTGMSQQAQAELFKPFSSTGDVITANQQNTGLGLYVCKNVVTRLGGVINIESALGKGTTAGIMIPLGA